VRFRNGCETAGMLDTSVRLLKLLTLLQIRRDWSGADLAGRLGVTTRTVRNDIERLRILGYEVSSSTGITGGYRLAAGTSLPPLVLDDDEAIAIAVSLRVSAGGTVTGLEETSLRALTKLEQTMPARLRHRLGALREATVSVASGAPQVDPDVLTAVAAACRDHQRLRFDYDPPPRSGEEPAASSVRTVEPHRLVHTGRRWYLLAYDLDRSDWRTFRADRITPRTPIGPRFTPRRPPDDAARHVVRGTGSLAWRHPARVRLHAALSTMSAQLPPAAGLLTEIDAETCLFETGTHSLPDLITFLTSLNVDFTVEHPPELRTMLRTLARRYAAASLPDD
jgi:predicted DNA-binding transcriptional regulator YafY